MGGSDSAADHDGPVLGGLLYGPAKPLPVKRVADIPGCLHSEKNSHWNVRKRTDRIKHTGCVFIINFNSQTIHFFRKSNGMNGLKPVAGFSGKPIVYATDIKAESNGCTADFSKSRYGQRGFGRLAKPLDKDQAQGVICGCGCNRVPGRFRCFRRNISVRVEQARRRVNGKGR